MITFQLISVVVATVAPLTLIAMDAVEDALGRGTSAALAKSAAVSAGAAALPFLLIACA